MLNTPKPTRLQQAQITQSAYGMPVPVAMGTVRTQQCLLWEDGFGAQTVAIQGGKGGGKGGTEYLYYVDVIAALCNGRVIGIGDVWSNSSWLGLPSAAETYTIASPGIYTPVNAPPIASNSNNYLNDRGVAYQLAYSGTYHDLGAPSPTVLSGTHLASLTQVPYGTALTAGTYSVNPASMGTFTLTSVANASGGNTVYTGTITGGGSNAFAGYTFVIAGFTNSANNGTFICASSTATTLTLQNASGVAETHAATATEPGNTYHFDAVHDAGKTLTLNYSFYLPNITQAETNIVPSSKTIHIGGTLQFLTDLGVVYSSGPNVGVRFKKVTTTPTIAGTYQLANNNGHGVDYKYSAADINAQVRTTWITQDQSLVPQGQTRSLNFQLFQGTQGQATWSLLTSKYPGADVGYSQTAYVAYHPMSLGTSGQISNNTFEVITPDFFGGGIYDCNPVQCLGQVLTNQQWGLGMGITPFPASVIDNGVGGTWGSAPSTPGTAQSGATAWNWFAANSFFISPFLDSQDTAASIMGKWLEAGMCAAFYSEGLLKLVSYGDTTCAANGCTWTAPTAYAAALDDTCYVSKPGQDPVKISRSAPQDAMNTVRVQWNNRSNQYSPEITQESDQAAINHWGERREDPQNWDFIHTLTAAQFAANLRVKHNVYIRNTYKFTLPYTYSYLEAMDIITISTTSVWAAGLNNANLGIVNQPVRITKIVDDPKTGLAITCEDYPWGAHLPTIFNKGISQANVVSNAYAAPGNVESVMFEATSRLTGFDGNTIVIGVLGTSSNYGSCNIWVSRDNTNFEQVGTVQAPARLGVLDSTFASGSDPDTVNSLVVDLAENCPALAAGSTADADNAVTLCYVDGEYIAYSASPLSGEQQYTMSGYIRRGLFGTKISSHAAGSNFLRLDQAIFKYQYDSTWAGQRLYFKLQPVNAFGNSATPLANLTSIPFDVLGTSGAIDRSTGLIIPYSQDSGSIVIQNGNFEASTVLASNGAPPGWKLQGGATASYFTSFPYQGSQSLSLATTGQGSGVVTVQKWAASAGDQFKLSAAVATNGVGTCGVQIKCYDKSGTFLANIAQVSTSSSGFTYSTSIGTCPANTISVAVSCEQLTTTNGTFFFDSVSVTRQLSLDNEVYDGGSFVRLLASHASGNVAYNFKGVWNSGASYVIGDETVYGQSYWLALAANTNSAPSTSNANWQVIGSYSGYQGAWSSITAYVAGAEVTYTGNYWICVTANTNSAPTTSNANWQVAGPANLDNIANGGVYVKSTYVAGDALLDNGNFEASTSILPPPGYALYSNTPTLAYDTSTQYSGAQSLKITTSGAGGGGVIPNKQFMCRPGDTFFASARAKVVSGTGSARVSISFRNAAGAGVGGGDAVSSSTSWVLVTNTQTAPAGTVYATFEIYGDAANTVVEFDEHYIRCVRNMDTEIADGPTYGRPLVSRLSSGKPLIDFSESIHLNKTLDYIGDGPVYTRSTNAAFPGNNALDNSTFQKAAATGSGDLVAGWKMNVQQGGLNAFVLTSAGGLTPKIGSQSIGLNLTSTCNITAGQTLVCRVIYDKVIPAVSGDQWTLRAWLNNSLGSVPAGITVNMFTQIRMVYSDGSTDFSGGLFFNHNVSDSGWTQVSQTATLPTGSGKQLVSMQMELELDITNTTGSTIVLNSAVQNYRFAINQVELIRVASLDSEVMDGPTYGRVNNTALTSNNVDPSKSGVLMKGNLAPTLSGGFSYLASTSQIQINWNNLTVYRANGTSTFIGTGSQIITGLLPNMIYQFYPYLVAGSSTLLWVSSASFPNIVGVTFNGTNQEVTTATQFILASAFSLEAWFKTTSTSTSNLGIITHCTPQTSTITGSEAGIYITNNGLLKCFIENSVGTTTSVQPATAYNDGQWHHAVETFANGVLTCYVDGIQISQTTGLGAINTANAWLRIGRGNTNVFFPGTISRVAYYNTALNIGQVNGHFQASEQGMANYDAAVAQDLPTYYWKLVETSGSSAADSAGTNTGTYVSAPSLNQSSPIMAPDGSPAIAWSAGPLLVQQAQTLQSVEALSAGPLAFQTPGTGNSGGGTGGTGSGGGGTGYQGGHGCFSGNTRVITQRGSIPISQVRVGDFVLTAKGTWRPVQDTLVYEPQLREMRDMGNGELSTPDHYVYINLVKTPAGEIFPDVVEYEGCVHNLSILTEDELERSYTLANGFVVSNYKTA